MEVLPIIHYQGFSNHCYIIPYSQLRQVRDIRFPSKSIKWILSYKVLHNMHPNHSLTHSTSLCVPTRLWAAKFVACILVLTEVGDHTAAFSVCEHGLEVPISVWDG